MTCNPPYRRKRLTLALAAMLAGGSTFTSCDTRLRTAVVGGTKNFIFSLFDPAVLFPDVFDQSASGGTGSNLP
ncbi:MAG: hypothetical protein AAB341_03395 [Planctomycetota bacterium]|jgi:hypothetical protein